MLSDPLREQLQTTLGDAYAVERELGGGGMSRVFVARESALRREVVIKVIAPDLAGGVSLDRFRREIEVAARLQHPNIVPLLAAGETGGLPYYTMPLVDGESLRARLARVGELPVREAVAILRDVARALAYAHGHGLVHRDVKPDNVLLSGDYAVVTDFGVAKAITAARGDALSPQSSTMTALGVAVGTPAYMAPEQSVGDPATDHRADIYAFGVMAYEMLAGEPPFTARTPQALMAAHAMQAPPLLSAKRPALPPALSALVMQCMEKRPADRPQGADEIVKALELVGSGETTATRAIAATSARRRRLLPIGVATAAVIVIGAMVYSGRRAATSTLDAKLMAVVPFRVASGDPSMKSLREGIVDLMAAKLTGTPRAIDTRAVLAAWRRAGGGEQADADPARLRSALRALRASRYIAGEIVESGQQVTIHGSITDLGSSSATPLSVTVTGKASAVPALVDTLVAGLLARSVGESEKGASELSTIPFAALQAYVAGQFAYRRGRYQEAVDHFVRALDEDSTFALAAVALSRACGWASEPRCGRSGPVLRAYGDRLTFVQRPGAGTRNGAELLAALERAVQTAPDSPELWYALADHLVHYGPVMGIPDAWKRALAGFNRAIAIDSTFSPALEHIPMIYVSLGDTAAAIRTLGLFPDTSDFLAANRAFTARSAADRREAVAALAKFSPGLTGLSAWFSLALVDAPSVADAETLMKSANARSITEEDRRAAARWEYRIALIRGQPGRAANLIDAAKRSPSAVVLDALFSDGDSVAAALAAQQMRALVAPGPRDSSVAADWISDVFALGQFDAAREGGVSRLRAAAASLRAARLPDVQQRRAARLAMILDAQASATDKSPDAPVAAARADSLLRLAEGSVAELSVSNLIVARVWERLGDARRAHAATKRTYLGPTPYEFASTYARERGRLAAAAGDNLDALRSYRRYLAQRENPEPSLVADREAVKKEIARLEKLTGGR